MTTPIYLHQRARNLAQTLLLLGGMMLLLGFSAQLIFGRDSFLWAALLVPVLFAFAPTLSPALILRLYGAQELGPALAPELNRLLGELSQRADLPSAPRLFYLASPVMNAFTVGKPGQASVVLSDGLLRAMNLRELAGILAHEVSHIQHNDMRIMSLADIVSRLTSTLSLFGQLAILINLPLFLLTDVDVPWLGLLLLVFAPSISALLQLALSRSREYDADLNAARLTADPGALASALDKLERYQGGWLEQILLPGRRNPDPSILRSHPHTEERIRRLMAIGASRNPRQRHEPASQPGKHHDLPGLRQPARRRWSGLWH